MNIATASVSGLIVFTVFGCSGSGKLSPTQDAAAQDGATQDGSTQSISSYNINPSSQSGTYGGYNFPSATAGSNGFIDAGFLNGQFKATGNEVSGFSVLPDDGIELTWTAVNQQNQFDVQPAYYRVYIQTSSTENGPYSAWQNGPAVGGISYLSSAYAFTIPSGWFSMWIQVYISACNSNNVCNTPPATTANLGIAYQLPSS